MENIPLIERQKGVAEGPKKSFQDQLIDVYRDRFPDAIQSTIAEQRERGLQLESVERHIEDRDIADIAHEYQLQIPSIERTEDGYYRIPVRNHFSSERLPAGYGYKGGAARALLLRGLNINPNDMPRDIDVVRLADEESFPDADLEVSERFMPEDSAHGYTVEWLADRDTYFQTRDFTLNEVFATDTEVIASRQCLLDSIRHIIRLTPYERDRIEKERQPNSKMLAKALRFYAEAIYRYDDATIEGIEAWEFEKYFITPFWLALQLDRSYQSGREVADRFTRELVQRKQIPEDISGPEEAATYLFRLMQDRPFYYRHAPMEQFDVERDWPDEDMETLPKQMGMGRGRKKS